MYLFDLISTLMELFDLKGYKKYKRLCVRIQKDFVLELKYFVLD